MTSDEELLSDVLQAYGYWVVNAPIKLEVGAKIRQEHLARPVETCSEFYVLEETDKADWDDYCEAVRKACGAIPRQHDSGYYYRIGTD